MVRMKRVDDGVDVSAFGGLSEAAQGRQCLAKNQILAYFKNTAPASAQEPLTGIEVQPL